MDGWADVTSHEQPNITQAEHLSRRIPICLGDGLVHYPNGIMV